MLKQMTAQLIMVVLVGACSDRNAGDQAPASAVNFEAQDFGNVSAGNLTISDSDLGASANALDNETGMGASYPSSPTDNDIVPSPPPPPEPEKPKPK